MVLACRLVTYFQCHFFTCIYFLNCYHNSKASISHHFNKIELFMKLNHMAKGWNKFQIGYIIYMQFFHHFKLEHNIFLSFIYYFPIYVKIILIKLNYLGFLMLQLAFYSIFYPLMLLMMRTSSSIKKISYFWVFNVLSSFNTCKIKCLISSFILKTMNTALTNKPFLVKM